MNVSEQLQDSRTSEERLTSLIKQFPINTHWYSNEWGHKKYFWISGYESSKDSNNVNILCLSLSFNNEQWCKKKTTFYKNSEYSKIKKDEFDKIERKVEQGFDEINQMSLKINEIVNNKDKYPIESSNLLPHQKFIQYINSDVTRMGEYIGNFKESNKFDDNYNSKIRQLTIRKKNDYDEYSYFTLITNLNNWTIDKKEKIFLLTEEEYNELNFLFDEMNFIYNAYMICETHEEYMNLKRESILKKYLTDMKKIKYNETWKSITEWGELNDSEFDKRFPIDRTYIILSEPLKKTRIRFVKHPDCLVDEVKVVRCDMLLYLTELEKFKITGSSEKIMKITKAEKKYGIKLQSIN